MTFFSRAWSARAVGVLLVGAVALGACAGSEASTAAVSGEVSTAGAAAIPTNGSIPLPTEVSLPTVDGGQLAFGDLAGQDTVLWFWAPW